MEQPILSSLVNHISLRQVRSEKGSPPWSHPLVLADHVGGVLICQNSGQENDRHCHDYDEWWVVLEGEIHWVIEGREDRPVKARAGDFVFVPARTFHQIFPVGESPSIRLGVFLPGHGHLHEKPARKVRVRVE